MAKEDGSKGAAKFILLVVGLNVLAWIWFLSGDRSSDEYYDAHSGETPCVHQRVC